MESALTISVGNSNTALGVFRGEEWIGRWRVATVAGRMPDDYLLLLDGLVGRCGLALADFDRIVLASVVPPATPKLLEMLEGARAKSPLVVGPGLDTGLRIAIDNPEEIGADLIANAAAAYHRFSASCIVVDFGTALSLTAVAEPGVLRGVAIAPGLHYAIGALAQNTSRLPTVPLQVPPAAIGTNTVHSIQSGVIFGYVGMVEHLVDRMRRELPGTTKVVATGGQAGVIAPLAGCFTSVEPWLTLEGLKLIALRNR